MPENSDNAEIERMTPPMPDVPVAPLDEASYEKRGGAASTVDDVKQKMTDEIKRGGAPYDFTGEIDKEKSGGGGFSPSGKFLLIAILALGGVAFAGWILFENISGRMENMAKQISGLTEQVSAYRASNKLTELSLMRAELKKALSALEGAIALGDVEVTKKALKLRDEVNAVLAELDRGSGAKMKLKPPKPVINPEVINKPEPSATVPGKMKNLPAQNRDDGETGVVDEETLRALFGTPSKSQSGQE